MSVYTRSGDNGFSSTLTRMSLAKDSPVFNLLGTLDELSSFMGLAKVKSRDNVKQILEKLQSDIISVSGEIAGGKKFADENEIKNLEISIDSIEAAIPPFDGFILPGKTECGALLDICRTVARRAERACITAKKLGGVSKNTMVWLNRLSDLLYVLARLCECEIPQKNAVQNATPTATGKIANFCDKAQDLCKRVCEYAKSRGVKAVVAICDDGGNQVALLREDGAYIASIDIAVNKAYTSAALKMPTFEVGRLALPDGPLYGIQNTNGGKIVIFGGGDPLVKDGVLVGAIGVSGGTAQQDTEFSRYGAEVFNKEM